MNKRDGRRITREYATIHKAEPGRVFPLLCPVREYEWIPPWHCELVYSQSGYAELGCVFSTDFGDQWGPEVWVVSDYLPGEKIAFVRTGTLRTTRYEVLLAAEEGGRATRLIWRQEMTGLTPEGDRLLDALTGQEFQAMMVELNGMLAYYLATGESAPADQAAIRREGRKC